MRAFRGGASLSAIASRRRSRGVALGVAAGLFILGSAIARQGVEQSAGVRFVIKQSPFVFGQAVDWLDDERVVYHDPFLRDDNADGEIHIHRSNLDGSNRVCLTCGLEGPNQVPVVQPSGKWIAFHSWNGHEVTVGGAGFGGIGSDVWVMTRNGERRTNLTDTGELTDNFHAYWSPDGRHLVWTSLSWNSERGGNGRSDIRVARFDPNGPNGPRLVGEHVVRPGNGHWYETQWWAPDGSGFLYTETRDTAINPELFYCHLRDPDRGACRPQRLTRDPAWDEQAVFTAGMERVIFMSSRNLPGAHNDWSQVAELLDLPAEYDYVLILPVFADSFLQPVLNQATDLYELDLQWNARHTRVRPDGPPRRLTRSGEQGWIIPEFAWDPGGERLLWTQNKFPDASRVDQSCVAHRIRDEIIARLQGIDEVSEVPFTIDRDIRDQAAELLRDPSAFSGLRGCGSGVTEPAAEGKFEQRTLIGRYLER